MKIRISIPQKAEQFAMLFQHIKVFTDHINISFLDDRMYVQCMDNSRVSIMEIVLPSSWFQLYEYTASTTIGISSSMLYKVLNSREKTQGVELEYLDNQTDTLRIHLRNPTDVPATKTDFEKHFEIPLIELDEDTMDIPGIEYQAEIAISSYHYATIINQLKMFGDTMELQCSEEKILLVSHSPENGKMFVEIKIDDLSSFIIDEGSQLQLSFSLTYLHNICLYNKIAKEVELQFSKDFPMKLTYFLDSGSVDPTSEEIRPKLSFYLAPKINDDE
jgi:proliferating cell nuclear antigen